MEFFCWVGEKINYENVEKTRVIRGTFNDATVSSFALTHITQSKHRNTSEQPSSAELFLVDLEHKQLRLLMLP